MARSDSVQVHITTEIRLGDATYGKALEDNSDDEKDVVSCRRCYGGWENVDSVDLAIHALLAGKTCLRISSNRAPSSSARSMCFASLSSRDCIRCSIPRIASRTCSRYTFVASMLAWEEASDVDADRDDFSLDREFAFPEFARLAARAWKPEADAGAMSKLVLDFVSDVLARERRTRLD